MGWRTSSTRSTSSTDTSTITSTTTTAVKLATKHHAHCTDAKLPLRTFKLWCFRKCSRSSDVAPPPAVEGSEVVAIERKRLPLWMRDASFDPAIWEHLPEEILEHILAFLPFPALFRCAAVSRSWRTMAVSSHVRVTRAAPSAVTPWPAYCPIRYTQTQSGLIHWSGFSTATNSWQPLPHLPLPSAPSSPSEPLLAGAGPLVVLYTPTAIVVHNPVTGRRRELPQPIQLWSRPDVLHMIITGDHYKIILAGTEAYSPSKQQATEVYDSATGRWVVTGRLPVGLYLDTQDAAYRDGLLFCTAQKAYTDAGDASDALVAYDVARGEWTAVAGHLPDESARQTPLTCGGRTVMAVAPVDDDGPVGRFFALNANSRRWELVASMPEPLHRRVRSWGVCSVVGGDLIVVVSDTAQGCVVAYDVRCATWSERRSPVSFSKSSKLFAKDLRLLAPISFRPDFNAVP